MFKERFKYWDDHLNPVLIKEIRQFFHNKLFLSLVAGLLGVQLLVLFIFNLSFESMGKDHSQLGEIFIIIDAILMYVCVFATAVWGSMQRFAAERASRELDFSNITLLTPWQIVGGKLASALVIWALTASLCLPFMTVAYFFRNVTPEEILFIFGAGVMPMLVLIQGALFCGTIGKKWVYALFLYFAFQAVAPMGIASLIPLIDGKYNGMAVFWMIQGGGFVLFIILLAVTVAMITPPYANRMFPLRLLLCAMMICVFALLPFLKSFGHKDIQALFCCFPLGIMIFLALFAVCDRDDPGGRVLAQIPANPVGRFFHYLLSSNRTGGVLLGLLVLGIFGGELLLLSFRQKESLAVLAFGLSGYALLYGELGILTNRFVREVPGWIWSIIITILLGFLPLLLAANDQIEVANIFTSPFCLLAAKDQEILNAVYYFAPAAAWCVGAVFIAQMCVTYKNYKAPSPPEAKKD